MELYEVEVQDKVYYKIKPVSIINSFMTEVPIA